MRQRIEKSLHAGFRSRLFLSAFLRPVLTYPFSQDRYFNPVNKSLPSGDLIMSVPGGQGRLLKFIELLLDVVERDGSLVSPPPSLFDRKSEKEWTRKTILTIVLILAGFTEAMPQRTPQSELNAWLDEIAARFQAVQPAEKDQ